MGNKIEVPTTVYPDETDWQNFIAWVDKIIVNKISISFSNMYNTSEPKIQPISIIDIAGSLYIFSAEEAATGWSVIANSTQAYMRLVVSGDTVSAEWTTTAPTYNDSYQGWYETGTDKRYILSSYKDVSGNYTIKTKIEDCFYGDNRYYGNNSILISGGVYIDTNDIYLQPTDLIKNSFASPSTSPTGLTYDGSTGNLISCDYGEDLIYIHDGISSTILSSFASPVSNLYGLAYDSSTGNLISCDNISNTIYIHDGISATILSSFASPDTGPTGLTYDTSTGNLISCNASVDKIYIHDGISSTILSSFASPNTVPTGLTYDISTGNLISCDGGADIIYIHNGVSSTILSSFASPSTTAYGLAHDSSTVNLISCDLDINKIYVHESQIMVP